MVLARKLLLVVLAAGAMHGVQACASETELNPQPLPPANERAEAPAPPEEGADKQNDGLGGGTSGSSSGGTPAAGSDAGPDGDAADGGGG